MCDAQVGKALAQSLLVWEYADSLLSPEDACSRPTLQDMGASLAGASKSPVCAWVSILSCHSLLVVLPGGGCSQQCTSEMRFSVCAKIRGRGS